jgi:phosphatidylglycerophosphatase A
VAGLFGLGVWACESTGRDLGVHDHPALVWDEMVGLLVALTAIPAEWPWVLAGFLLFRLLDILKPWPLGLLDRGVRGGLGVMLDDAAAGAMVLGVLHAARALGG